MSVRGIALLLVFGVAQAQEAAPPVEAPPLVLGVYAPLVFFPNSSARNQYAAEVAQALQGVTGISMRGRGFSKGFRGSDVDFAIVDAPYLATAGSTALAQATWKGKARRSMVLVVGGKVEGDNIGALKGIALANPPVPKSAAFVANYLLQRQVDPLYFATARRKPADVQGALSLVRLGRADATFTYEGSEAGLRRVFLSRPVPLPVFVQVRNGLPAEVVAKVRSAVTKVRVPNGLFDAFSAFPSKVHAPLRRALRSGTGRTPPGPVVVSSRGRPPSPPAFLDVGEPAVVMPAVAGDLQVPDPPADVF